MIQHFRSCSQTRLCNLIFNSKIWYSTTTLKSTCWACGKEVNRLVSDLFCSYCQTIQKPNKNYSYFKLFGLEESFDIDEVKLSNKYKQLQRNLHPDKFANKATEELSISEEYSSLVNEAYQTLLQPLSRGIYMLNLKGKQIPEETQLDKDFLMDIMLKNEAVENAETKTEILELERVNKETLQDLQQKLSKAFYAGELDTVTRILAEMKYYTSIDSQIQKIIRDRGIIK